MSDQLVIPADLAAWHRWSARQHRLRTLRARFHSAPTEPVVTTYRNSAAPPTVIVAVASTSASAQAALFAPLQHLSQTSVAVISEIDCSHLLPGWGADTAPWQTSLASAHAVLGDGHYLALGHQVWVASRKAGIPYFVSQHGALTPLAPPLPPDAHLLAWSDQDSAFWTSGRTDLRSTPVGSQLLWRASNHGGVQAASTSDAPITYAGQLHGSELPRGAMSRAALAFCRANSAVYRPHPNERDVLSRVVHAGFVRAGIKIEDSSQPLSAERGGLVSVFSTSVLEAAASGRPAWVDFPSPPPWLASFWTRYGMSRWGEEPTLAPAMPAEEPAAHIMRVVLEHC